jgi:hypothetical protein
MGFLTDREQTTYGILLKDFGTGETCVEDRSCFGNECVGADEERRRRSTEEISICKSRSHGTS